MAGGRPWPLISVVTPSFNQGEFLEETIRSILLQGYPSVQLIVIDGGSTDATSVILRRYRPFLAEVVSERDNGQSHALNKGFARARGDLIGWQNSDDLYAPRAFEHAALAWARLHRPDVIYGKLDLIDTSSAITGAYLTSAFNPVAMFPWANMFNQSMFFSRRFLQEPGPIDESYHHCMDYELFWRLILKGYYFQYVPEIVGRFRLHSQAKGSTQTDVAAREFFRIYQMLYRRTDPRPLPPLIRRAALESMRGLCVDHFGKSKWELFHEQIRALRQTVGCTRMGGAMLLRYALSLLGPKRVEQLKRQRRPADAVA
jgi:glycosyltransferase involved in cell wall biosynthesis